MFEQKLKWLDTLDRDDLEYVAGFVAKQITMLASSTTASYTVAQPASRAYSELLYNAFKDSNGVLTEQSKDTIKNIISQARNRWKGKRRRQSNRVKLHSFELTPEAHRELVRLKSVTRESYSLILNRLLLASATLAASHREELEKVNKDRKQLQHDVEAQRRQLDDLTTALNETKVQNLNFGTTIDKLAKELEELQLKYSLSKVMPVPEEAGADPQIDAKNDKSEVDGHTARGGSDKLNSGSTKNETRTAKTTPPEEITLITSDDEFEECMRHNN